MSITRARLLPALVAVLALAPAALAAADAAPLPLKPDAPGRPEIRCQPAPERWEEGQRCPHFPTCTLSDLDGEVRASFRGHVWWSHADDPQRIVVGLGTCRHPEVGRETDAYGPGDAPIELLEVHVPAGGGDLQWFLLARTGRGELGCHREPGADHAACVSVHVQRGLVEGWLLHFGKDGTTTATHVVPATDAPVRAIHEVPRVRHREGRYEVHLDDPEGWFPLVPSE